MSDSSNESNGSNGSTGSNGNLVQKQIERLYGGKVQTVRVLSPESRKSPSSDQDDSADRKQGFFTKRFGISQQKELHTANDSKIYEERTVRTSTNGTSPGSNPLDFKPLKVPAVFRLLRPEFREQLKNNSCQIPNDQTSPSRILSISKSPSKERVIPIQREGGKTQGKF